MKQSSRAGLSLKSYTHMWPGLVLTLLAAFSFLLATFCLLLTASSRGSHPRGCSKALGAPREVAAGLVGPEPLGGDKEKPHSTRSRATRGRILLGPATSSRTAPHGAGTASRPQCHLARHGRRRAASQRGCHFCGVSATNLGSLPLLWGHCHFFGVSATSLGSLPPLWGLHHLSRVSVTSSGSLPPLRGLCHLFGVSATSAGRCSSPSCHKGSQADISIPIVANKRSGSPKYLEGRPAVLITLHFSANYYSLSSGTGGERFTYRFLSCRSLPVKFSFPTGCSGVEANGAEIPRHPGQPRARFHPTGSAASPRGGPLHVGDARTRAMLTCTHPGGHLGHRVLWGQPYQ